MFLKGLYSGNMSQVRVNNCRGEEFAVMRGLHQGCVLSPLLFSLYINSLVSKLKHRDCGVLRGGMRVSSRCLQMTVLFAESAEDKAITFRLFGQGLSRNKVQAQHKYVGKGHRCHPVGHCLLVE